MGSGEMLPRNSSLSSRKRIPTRSAKPPCKGRPAGKGANYRCTSSHVFKIGSRAVRQSLFIAASTAETSKGKDDGRNGKDVKTVDKSLSVPLFFGDGAARNSMPLCLTTQEQRSVDQNAHADGTSSPEASVDNANCLSSFARCGIG